MTKKLRSAWLYDLSKKLYDLRLKVYDHKFQEIFELEYDLEIMSHKRSKVSQIKMRFRRWSYCFSQDCKISATIVYCWLSQWTLRRSEFFQISTFWSWNWRIRYLTCYVETKHRTKRRIFRRKYVFICENKFLSALFRETKCQKCIPGIYLIIQLEVWNFEILKNFQARHFLGWVKVESVKQWMTQQFKINFRSKKLFCSRLNS